MSFTFDALGDGNCFYNSITVRLAVDWLNGTLPKNATTRNQLVALFREVDKFAPELKIGEKLSGRIGPKTVDDIFHTILNSCRINEETINWVQYQKLMGPVAREFIIQQIENNPTIKEKVLHELVQHLTGTLDISTVDDINYPAYFQGMPVIQQKLKAAVMDVTTDIATRKIHLANWFHNEKDAEGFGQWLRGENGIALDTTLAGVVELEVFSELFKMSAQFRMPGDQQGVNQLITGFGDPTPIRLGTAEAKAYTAASTYSLEYTGGHWKIYLPEDEQGINKKIDADYIPQRAAYSEYMSILEKHNEAKVHLREHKSYAAHALTLGLAEYDYCAIYHLSHTEYENNTAPAKLPKPWEKKSVERLDASSSSRHIGLATASSKTDAQETDLPIPSKEPIPTKFKKPTLPSANPASNSISLVSLLLMIASAVVIYSNPITLPTALFAIAFCASAATLGLNLKETYAKRFAPKTAKIIELDTGRTADNAADFTSVLQTRPEALLVSAPEALGDTSVVATKETPVFDDKKTQRLK